MFKVYVGNLHPDVDEGTLRGLFEDHGIAVGNILLKRSYAFVECPDQANADRAIDKFNGYNLLGTVMQVEPSMSRRRRSNKILIRNISPHVSREEVEQMCGQIGPIQKCEQVGAEGVFYVTYDTPDQAQEAQSQLNGLDYQGSALKVDFANNRGRRGRMNSSNNSGMNRQELPLRIFVGSEFVGAIIGRQGQTIHNITSQSKARVDIHRRENVAATETMVTIKGSPESCTQACKEIMMVVQQEAQALNKGEYPLKVVCPNSLCGRIIGKSGNVIRSFMEETGTRIVVSSAADINNYYLDRVISVSGPAESASNAEALISEKMRKCFDQDAQNYGEKMGFENMERSSQQMQQMGMYGGFGGMGSMMQNLPPYPSLRPPYPPSPYSMQQEQGNGFYPGMFGGGQMPQQELEVTYLYIPEHTVGAVIGSKGSNIKEIMRISNARIKILPPGKNGEMNGDQKMPVSQHEERKVIITGTREAQWKAQFCIFEKVRIESGFSKVDEVHLRSEVMVPKGMIGRIIGKGGQNVRELQRVSTAIIKLPDTASQGDMEEVPVTIIGHFYATQPAHCRIRALISQRTTPPMGGGPQRRRPGPGREQNGK